MVKALEASEGTWPFRKYGLAVAVTFEYGETLSTAWRHIKEALVHWQGRRARACKALTLTFEAEREAWPHITDSVARNGREEAFLAPFFTQLEGVTLTLVTPDGGQKDEVQFSFRKVA